MAGNPHPVVDARHPIGYPRALHRRPSLVRWYHAAAHATTLRNWYVRRRIRPLIAALPKNGRVLDVGCGSGDHLFYSLRLRPDIRAVGIDRSEECIALCRSFAAARGFAAEFIASDLDASPPLPISDLATCITVLQYVEDDSALLRNIRSAVSHTGRLLVYSPIRNERSLGLFAMIVEGRRQDYDTSQRRRRVYDLEGLKRKVESAGFEVERIEEAYGALGKIYFEIFETLLHLSRGRGWRYPAALSLVLLMPFLVALMMLDFLLPVRRGNGVLIVAR